jgi:hypothetical protein
MIAEDHPYFFLASLLAKENAIFHLSKYVYTSDTIFDEREYLSVASSELTVDWVNHAIASLRSDQELALHSRVTIKERTLHIPMIDFSLEDALDSRIIDRMRMFLPRDVMNSIAIFNSGRSFHAYSTTLISPKNWIELMGRLLLINPRNGNQIIDARWIGHRLIGGYSSLRWSNNTQLYADIPKRIALPI